MSKETITIYRCDNCKESLSNPHLSINFSGHSGRVAPKGGQSEAWTHTATLRPGIYQFCNTSCLSAWVDKELVEETV